MRCCGKDRRGYDYDLLKLFVSTEDRPLLGVHVFGTKTTGPVHTGAGHRRVWWHG